MSEQQVQPVLLVEWVWRRQFDQVAAALAPWVREDAEGFRYVAPSAPRRLVAHYRSLLSTGYAYGWMP